MKKYIIPVLTVIVLVSLVLSGCAKPAAAPAPTPEAEPATYQALKDAGLVRADLPLNPSWESSLNALHQLVPKTLQGPEAHLPSASTSRASRVLTFGRSAGHAPLRR